MDDVVRVADDQIAFRQIGKFGFLAGFLFGWNEHDRLTITINGHGFSGKQGLIKNFIYVGPQFRG